eukprot:COSAG01_NODE_5643_length_4121_cov_2.779960_2_plen_112_part_00
MITHACMHAGGGGGLCAAPVLPSALWAGKDAHSSDVELLRRHSDPVYIWLGSCATALHSCAAAHSSCTMPYTFRIARDSCVVPAWLQPLFVTPLGPSAFHSRQSIDFCAWR